MSEVNLDQAQAIAQAKERNCKVYRGRASRLLVDLDGMEAVECFEERIKFVDAFLPLEVLKAWKSSSSDGIHVVIKLDRELSAPERFLLQAILGSDIKREMYSLARYWEGQKEPSLLFRPKDNKAVLGPDAVQRALSAAKRKRKQFKTKGYSMDFDRPDTLTDDDVPF